MSTRALRQTATSSSRRVLALEFIRRYFRDYGQSPSFGEIGAAIGVATQHVSPIVRELYKRGEILWTAGAARSIKLPDRTGELSDTEVLEILRRRGWAVMVAAPVTESVVPSRPAPGEKTWRTEGGHGGTISEIQEAAR